MSGDLREVLKKSLLSESYGAGAVGGKMKKKPKKAKADDKLKSLVKQIMKEEMAQGAGMRITVTKKKKKSKKGGFIGKHPMDYTGGCDDCCKHCGGLLAGGPVGGTEYVEKCKMVRKKSKPMKQLFPHQSAMKALTGVKFSNKNIRMSAVSALANTLFNEKLSVAKNAKVMREEFIKTILPDFAERGWIISIPESFQ